MLQSDTSKALYEAVRAGFSQPVYSMQNSVVMQLHFLEQNKLQITLLIQLLHLVSFCYYIVVDKNCMQANAKLSATHTINCL